jgi:hypothetical protein
LQVLERVFPSPLFCKSCSGAIKLEFSGGVIRECGKERLVDFAGFFKFGEMVKSLRFAKEGFFGRFLV